VSTGNYLNASKKVSVPDSILGQSESSLNQEAHTDAHTVTLLRRLQSAAFAQCLRFVYQRPLQRAILLEFRSLFLRIEMLRETKLYEPGNLRNPRLFLHATEYPPSCECEIACTRDTRSVLSKHPWATALDQVLFWEGWDMGARAHRCKGGTSCCCTEHKGNRA
jgi:hypothetical protein